jgi:ornithine cyclodeaminase/alanine dehydrogenase-like protein (mu-crystallin family)
MKVASTGPGGRYFAAKTNGNFFDNAAHGLPRIQGVIVLADAANGTPLAVMDSIEITILRTAAATAVAAQYLAPVDASVVTIAGCGVQGRAHVDAIAHVRKVREWRLFDTDAQAARTLATYVEALGARGVVVEDLGASARTSDIVVTCTPARAAILDVAEVAAGAFVGAVGTDSEDKQEIAPALLAASDVVVDSLDQCATFGDLAHAIAAGVMTRGDVRATLGEVVARRRLERADASRPIVFDSTGIAIQDVAAAGIVYERALEQRCGTEIAINT